jgi:hypothetical protein
MYGGSVEKKIGGPSVMESMFHVHSTTHLLSTIYMHLLHIISTVQQHCSTAEGRRPKGASRFELQNLKQKQNKNTTHAGRQTAVKEEKKKLGK